MDKKPIQEIQKSIDKAQAKTRLKKKKELAKQHEEGELLKWHKSERGIPNELVRCALFSAKNRNTKRKSYDPEQPLIIPIIGGGEVVFIGKELRQEDETVWMQLIQYAKEAKSPYAVFTSYGFVKRLGWDTGGKSYKRLLTILRRLGNVTLEVASHRFKRGVSAKLIARYEYPIDDPDGFWRVKVFDNDDDLMLMFEDLYSRVNFETRLLLPEGITTWLHGFFASHRDSFGHSIETLAVGAGLTLESEEDRLLTEKEQKVKKQERLREAKKIIIAALEKLKQVGFLLEYKVTASNIVNVTRNP